REAAASRPLPSPIDLQIAAAEVRVAATFEEQIVGMQQEMDSLRAAEQSAAQEERFAGMQQEMDSLRVSEQNAVQEVEQLKASCPSLSTIDLLIGVAEARVTATFEECIAHM
ncbi:hypothetical protein HK102_003307, partial [Quaeritorhiza haematococci]